MTNSNSILHNSGNFRADGPHRHRLDRHFRSLCLVFTLLGFVTLLTGVAFVFLRALAPAGSPANSAGWLSPQIAFFGRLLKSPLAQNPAEAGYRIGLGTSTLLLVFTLLFAVPVAVGAALFLEEYCRESRFRSIALASIASLSGLPSVVAGILAFSVFQYGYFGGSPSAFAVIVAGSLTLAIICVPIIVVATRESLQAIPQSIRYAALALGATRWQLIRDHLLPAALPGIVTGCIRALTLAIGEAAALLLLGASLLQNYDGLYSPKNTLPAQIYFYASQPNQAFSTITAGGILMLLALILAMHGLSALIKQSVARRHPDQFAQSAQAGK